MEMEKAVAHASKTIGDLQAETQRLLEAAEQLLRLGEGCLGRADHYQKLVSAVGSERRKVSSLELRLSIVAPMKAGKSTIVNAVLGAGVLPTRNSAMTTIPTEIIDDPALSEPELTIPESTLLRFKDLWHQLHQVVIKRGIESCRAAATEYPELQALVTQLGVNEEAPLVTQVVGTQAIQETLLRLNDLFRVAAVVLEERSPFSGMKNFELPRLRSRFLRSSPTFSAVRNGALVIVDTPGPNEARQHHLLEQVVAEQLGQTSLVLLVLDFTQLNTQAAELISKEVQSVARIVGEENIFVIVNKIDERDEKGMTSEQVRQFVSAHLSFKKPIAASRIFEISAKQAFRAADFLREYEQSGAEQGGDVRSWRTAIELAPLVFGATQWEEDLSEVSEAALVKRARRLWGISGFDAFLKQSIERLLAEVAPRALKVALSVTRAHLATLRNDSRLRHKAIRASTATVESELANLDRELKNLEESRRRIDARLREVEKDLRNHLAMFRRRLQPVIANDIRNFFKENEDSGNSFFVSLLKKGRRFLARRLGDPLGGVSPVAEFEKLAEAQSFADDAIEFALSKTRPSVEEALRATSRRVDATRREFESVLSAETAPILQRAAERVKRQFDVALDFPKPRLANPLEKISLAKHVTRFMPGGIEVRTDYERRWYTLWLYRHEIKYEVRIDDKYIVALDEVAFYVSQAVHRSVEQIEVGFDDFLATDFKNSIDEYFGRLREYFQFYRQALEEAAQAQRMSLEQRDATLRQLDVLDEEGSKILAAIEVLGREVHALSGGADPDEGEDGMTRGVDAFISYAHSDENLRQELEKHLALLRREGLIHLWHDREIEPGQSWASEIDRHLEGARLILLLVSSDFIASEYCFAKELMHAIERHRQGTATVVPVILRSCDWQSAPFGALQALPRDGKAITSWSDRDAAFTDVAQGLRKVLQRMKGEGRVMQ